MKSAVSFLIILGMAVINISALPYHFDMTIMNNKYCSKPIATTFVSRFPLCIAEYAKSYTLAGYAYKDRRCYLYDKIPESCITENIGAKLYIRKTEYILPQYYITQKKGSPGNDIKIITDATIAKCHAWCQSNSKCIAFSINFRRKMCWLKDTLLPSYQYRSRSDNLMYRKDKTVRKIFNFETHPHRSIDGNFMKLSFNGDPQSCSSFCSRTSGCVAVSVHSNACRLYSKVDKLMYSTQSHVYVKK
ncbi:DgyrCDS14747 [Dimorphilus gyrociliatus]|uniref:DgyrCDS14747 n=1 Tax=Dimorphilus gyrociliatus TaxID=2664684 RepID=A0A7I8WEP3_9ANNE|nr:DgyrCDS14747 [Dimorphilus gyrociliatus]